jgi:hypothetical protein
MLGLKRAGGGQAPNLTDWTEKRPGFANRTQAPTVLGISKEQMYEHTRGISLPSFARYRP